MPAGFDSGSNLSGQAAPGPGGAPAGTARGVI